MIVLVLATVAIASFGGAVHGRRVEAAAERIIADVGLARTRALTTGSDVEVVFQPDLDTYTLPTIVDPDHSDRKYQVDLSKDPYEVEIVSVALIPPAALGDPIIITFDRRGQADRSATIVIRSGDRTLSVALDADTGRATRQ